jgi:acetylornithine deacetylase/succinyl-diaminopimelate desuccinylase-like protein
MPTIPLPTDFLSQLVACPSVTPATDGIAKSYQGEAGMVRLLESLLAPWVDHIETHEVEPGRPNLVARFDGKDASRSYALEAHTDTVGIEGMTTEPFKPVIREGRLFGRGACDTKGPMTAMLLALMRARQTLGQLPVTWYFVATCGEELGGLGAAALVERGFRCDGIIVGEPTHLEPVHNNKWAIRYRVELMGKAAHSAYPELGVHAVHAAAQWIQTMLAKVAATNDALPPCPTGSLDLSVGTVQGGDQVNRIPDKAVMEIDLRVPTTCPLERVAELLAAANSESEQKFPGLHIAMTQTQCYPPFALAPDANFRRQVTLLEKVSKPTDRTARYATNAGFYAAANIPCVVYGPGDIAQAHTADEWIELPEIETAALRLQHCIENG